MPKPGPEHEALHRFAGQWIADETMHPTPWGPGGKAEGRMEARVGADGFFVLTDYTQIRDGKASFHGHGVHGYDAQRGHAWYWVDSMGNVPAAPTWGHRDGDTLVYENEMPHGRGRYTFRFHGGDRYDFKMEHSQDGHTWTTFLESTYRRA
jgi:hypothetical protein